MLVIGSHAILAYISDFRVPGDDLDVIMSPSEFQQFTKDNSHFIANKRIMKGGKYALYLHDMLGVIEVEIAYPGSSAEELLLSSMSAVDVISPRPYGIIALLQLNNVKYALPDEVYALKMSHRFLRNSPHFHKTRKDLAFLRQRGCSIPSYLEKWYKRREKETYDYNHPKLNMNKSAFFDTPGVTYKYDHDSLHLAIKIGDVPAYSCFMVEGAEVMCSREKFEQQPFDVKINAVIEESMVLALERCLVPFNFSTAPRQAFLMALDKVCTSITSGWFREFAWEHYDEAVARYDDAYVTRFLDGLRTGIVRLHG